MAKMRTYCAWPAQIIKIRGKRTEVFFFGTNQTGTVDTNKISFFKHCHTNICRLLQRKKNIKKFIVAVKEVEVILKIPDHLSLLNNN